MLVYVFVTFCLRLEKDMKCFDSIRVENVLPTAHILSGAKEGPLRDDDLSTA